MSGDCFADGPTNYILPHNTELAPNKHSKPKDNEEMKEEVMKTIAAIYQKPHQNKLR